MILSVFKNARTSCRNVVLLRSISECQIQHQSQSQQHNYSLLQSYNISSTTIVSNQLPLHKPVHHQQRTFATGSRGSRGYGWFYHYRQGNGGRHLQGEYYDRDSIEACMAWNTSIVQLGSQQIYIDIVAEPRRNTNTNSSSSTSSQHNPKKYFEVKPLDTLTGDKHRIKIDIASTVLPATCDNFINLIKMNQNTKDDTTTSIKKGYRGTRLYRIEKDVGIYGGDVVTNTGKMGMAHNAVALTIDVSKTDPIPMWHIPGTITMVVPKVNEIDSRFLLCTQYAPHLDGICRPFGMIHPDSLLILQKWQMNLLTLRGIPNAFDLIIADCGVLDTTSSNTQKQKPQQQHKQQHPSKATANLVDQQQ